MFHHNHSPSHRQKGQGFVEYGIILLLVGIAVVVALALLRPAIEEAFERFIANAPVAPPSIGPIGGQFTPRPAPTVAFAASSYVVGEVQANFNVGVTLSYAFTQDVTVVISTQPDTAGAVSGSCPGTPNGDEDFVTTSISVVIPEGSTSVSVPFPTPFTCNDTIAEPDEILFLTLTNASVPNVGGNATVTILDDDVPPVFSFTESAYSIPENAGPLPVVITMDRMLGVNAVVNLRTTNITATGGNCPSSGDYQAYNNQPITFPAGTISQTVSICIRNDSTPQADKRFSLSLTAVSPPGSSANPSTPVVTIIDDETPPTLTFTATNTIVDEAGPNAYLYVTLSHAYGAQVVVDYQTFSGTATRGADFTPTDSPLTFAPGVTHKIITIPINNDTVAEEDETFTVRLVNPNPSNIPIGIPNPVTVTILDNDCAYGPFNVPGTRIEAEDFLCGAQGVTHSDSDGTNTASPSSPYRIVDAPGVDVRANNTGSSSANRDISQTVNGEWLNYAINVAQTQAYDLVVRASSTVNNASFRIRVDGNIVSGADPVPVPNTGNANTFQNITVPGIALLAGNRTLRLEIVGGGANYDYITINNTAGPPIRFNASTYTVNENGGQATITVDLGFVTSQEVRINYATSNGTATAGQDYTATSGQLIIPALQNNGTFVIPITNDSITEAPAETVNLTLSNPVNGQLGTPSTAVLYILDDECSFGPYTIPTLVEAENFTCGGQGVAYNDTTTSPANQGTSSYRFWEAVDLFSGGTSNGVYVGATANGEWLNYRVNAGTAGYYNVTVRAAATNSNAQFSLQVDGGTTYGPFSVPNAGAGNYNNIMVTGMYLTAGQHTIRLNIINGNATYDYLNFTTLSGLLLTLNDDNNTITGPSNVPLTDVNDEDIVLFTNGSYSLFFDGSDVGIGQNLQGFQLLPDGTILMTFANLFNSGGNTYNPQDIARFTPTSLGTNTSGSFSMAFDGSNFGLPANNANAAIDGFYYNASQNRYLISTVGDPGFSITGNSGGNNVRDEDIFQVDPSTGIQSWYLDGSDVGFDRTNAAENIVAFGLNGNGHVYFSTFGNFNVSHSSTSLSGRGNDIGIFIPTFAGPDTTGTFVNPLYFVGGVSGNNLNGLAGELISGFFVIP